MYDQATEKHGSINYSYERDNSPGIRKLVNHDLSQKDMLSEGNYSPTTPGMRHSEHLRAKLFSKDILEKDHDEEFTNSTKDWLWLCMLNKIQFYNN